MGLSISVCVCLFLSVFVCPCLFLPLSFCVSSALNPTSYHVYHLYYLLSVHHLNHDQHIFNLQHIFYVLLTFSLFKNTRITFSSALSGHPSSSSFLRTRGAFFGCFVFVLSLCSFCGLACFCWSWLRWVLFYSCALDCIFEELVARFLCYSWCCSLCSRLFFGSWLCYFSRVLFFALGSFFKSGLRYILRYFFLPFFVLFWVLCEKPRQLPPPGP